MAPIRPNPTLSEDLISEILVRVQVKSLLRCKAVCKTWLALIKHPDFVKSQLRHATTIETDQTLIMSRYKDDGENNFVQFQVDSRQIMADLKYPYSRDEFRYVPSFTLVGSANGIVCVVVDLYNVEVKIYLWNPATRQSKVIPAFRDIHHEALGFGYDPINHDYKVVRVGMPPSFCEVYSSNGNVWGGLPDSIDTPMNGDFDVCVNGLLCGIGDYGLMTFDLNKEVFNCGIKLPHISVDAAVGYDYDNGDGDHIDDNYNNNDDYGDGDDDGDGDGDHIDDYDDGDGDGDHIDDNYNNNDDYGDGDGDDDENLIFKIYGRIFEFNKSIGVILSRNNGVNDNKKTYMWTLDDDACLRGGRVEASWTPMFCIDFGIPADIVHAYLSYRDLLIIMDESYAWISYNVDKKEAKIVQLSVDMANHHFNRQIYKYTESLVSLEGFRQVNWNAGDQ